MSTEVFIGIDLGTGGVRALAVTASGEVLESASAPLVSEDTPPGTHEQRPEAWWRGVCDVCQALMAKLGAGVQVAGLSVDGTSGTVAPLAADGSPLRPGLMYNDGRATAEADQLNELGADLCAKLGYRFAASYALAKMLWVRDNEPAVFENTAQFVHQGDVIIGNLTGDFGVSDYSNALKTGYDLVDECWPAWIAEGLGFGDMLPRVVAPGTVVGEVTQAAAAATGLPRGTKVITGATDGTAACLASGMKRLGDYNTTVGTTLVFKGMSDRICQHPDGLVYCHKLPGGRWLPGAASNTGAEWITKLYAEHDAAALDAEAAPLLPTAMLAYPVAREGERFPFLHATARGFCEPAPGSVAEGFAARLQGTAFVERMAYGVLDEVSGVAGGEVFSTGGGSRSDVWMQCRADVTGRTVHRPACPESAFGSAVLAAATLCHGDVWAASEAMVKTVRSFTPDPVAHGQYDEHYRRFAALLKERGYA